ncbi:cell envelope integrity protein CreD [Flavobacterium sp. DGU11]|uniref:Cell envelope integrity protein CreD n=1 Tax=Flavobacterium arundinis TaxID=3139143 RepID=A0ABU9I163_9FLAO
MEILNQNQNQPEDPNKNFLHSTTARIVMVGVLTLVLLIPLQYVKNLIFDRSQLQRHTEETVSAQWGGNVYVYGPVLKIPYKNTKKNGAPAYAYFFPEKLDITANVVSESKRRNTYKSAVFNAGIKFSGNYTTPNFSKSGISPENIDWERATIQLNTGNLKGIKGAVAINFNGKRYNFEPASRENSNDSMVALETKTINLRDAFAGGVVNFSMDVSYNGTKRLAIVPIGKLTETQMISNWHKPLFGGNFMPEKESDTATGATACWKISHLNRPFAQQHFGSLPDLKAYSFNVDFIIPVNEYEQNERAAKYGFLVIGLTFLIFFLIQSMSRISIHIFQYIMIGLALIMFYTLLISITEHSSFRFAYIIAGLSVVAMITLYSISILKDRRFPMFIAAALTGLYTFIYVIIQLEEYALLAGSIGLFLILGAVMYFSRRIDWNK